MKCGGGICWHDCASKQLSNEENNLAGDDGRRRRLCIEAIEDEARHVGPCATESGAQCTGGSIDAMIVCRRNNVASKHERAERAPVNARPAARRRACRV